MRQIRQSIQQWHGGQLAIVWVVLVLFVPIAAYIAFASYSATDVIYTKRALAIRDSTARAHLDTTAVSARLSQLIRDGYSLQIAMQIIREETGLQDTSFRAPATGEVRNATLLRFFVSYPFAFVTLLLLPAGLMITWIWLSGRRSHDR